tara:strand:- start:456 stop:581 length:126 start_codon:yes stop_codon:yes gene_type:complete
MSKRNRDDDYMTFWEVVGSVVFFGLLLANLYFWAWIAGGYV